MHEALTFLRIFTHTHTNKPITTTQYAVEINVKNVKTDIKFNNIQ